MYSPLGPAKNDRALFERRLRIQGARVQAGGTRGLGSYWTRDCHILPLFCVIMDCAYFCLVVCSTLACCCCVEGPLLGATGSVAFCCSVEGLLEGRVRSPPLLPCVMLFWLGRCRPCVCCSAQTVWRGRPPLLPYVTLLCRGSAAIGGP